MFSSVQSGDLVLTWVAVIAFVAVAAVITSVPGLSPHFLSADAKPFLPGIEISKSIFPGYACCCLFSDKGQGAIGVFVEKIRDKSYQVWFF